MRTFLPLLMALVLIPLAGCDDEDVDARLTTYSGALAPLNGSGVSGDVSITLDRDTDEIIIAVDADGLFPGIAHAQHVHALAECPDTSADDANGDGFLDVTEGLPTYGEIALPLDDDIGNATADTFPTASGSGAITYSEAAGRTDVQTAFDGSVVDAGRRTIVLHGVDPAADLPPTVATLTGLTAEQTLPVACATLDL